MFGLAIGAPLGFAVGYGLDLALVHLVAGLPAGFAFVQFDASVAVSTVVEVAAIGVLAAIAPVGPSALPPHRVRAEGPMRGFRPITHRGWQSAFAVAAIAAAVSLPVVLLSVGGGVSQHEIDDLYRTPVTRSPSPRRDCTVSPRRIRSAVGSME